MIRRRLHDPPEDFLPRRPLSRRIQVRLSEVDAPYVRYSPAPSSISGTTTPTSESDSLSSHHDSAAVDPPDPGLITVYLRQNRAVCNICIQDFQRRQVEQTEPLEPLRQLPCNHVFHESCITQAISQSLRQFSFECPTCRRSVNLRRHSDQGERSELENPPSNPAASPSPWLIRRERSGSLSGGPAPAQTTGFLNGRIHAFDFFARAMRITTRSGPGTIVNVNAEEIVAPAPRSTIDSETDFDYDRSPASSRHVQSRMPPRPLGSGARLPSSHAASGTLFGAPPLDSDVPSTLYSDPYHGSRSLQPASPVLPLSTSSSTSSAPTPDVLRLSTPYGAFEFSASAPHIRHSSTHSTQSGTPSEPVPNTHRGTSPGMSPPQMHPVATRSSTRSVPVRGSIPSSTFSSTLTNPGDQRHLCRLRDPLKPTFSAPRKPCISEESAPHVSSGPSTLECAICDQPLVPDEPSQSGAASQVLPEPGSSNLRQASCGHVFHADCLDELIPSCECQLLAGDIECLTCSNPIPLQSQGLDAVGAMIYNPVIPIMRAFGNMVSKRPGIDGTSIRDRFWHQAPGPAILPSNPPSTWFRELLMDYRLLASFRHQAHLKHLNGLTLSQRWTFKMQSIFSGRPHFEKFLRVLEEKGTITFNNGTIRGPDGLWGHYILVSSVQDLALREGVVGQVIWGVQRTAEGAKDAAALKVLRQLRGDDRVLE